MNKIVRNKATKKEYIVDKDIIKASLELNENNSFDCMFNDITMYDKWLDDYDTLEYADFDSYLMDHKADYTSVYSEDLISLEKFKEEAKNYKYYWNSYNRTIIPIKDLIEEDFKSVFTVHYYIIIDEDREIQVDIL